MIFLLLAAQQPQGMHDLLSNRHWAWIPANWNALAQLPALLFLLATAALGWQAWRHPRPLHTAMLLALLRATAAPRGSIPATRRQCRHEPKTHRSLPLWPSRRLCCLLWPFPCR